MIVGEVVNLHRKLAWFRGTPLLGLTPPVPKRSGNGPVIDYG